MKHPLIALAAVAVLAVPLFAQEPPPAAAVRHPEEGRPLVLNIFPDEYGGGGQNWAMVQDSRGVLFVGSAGGVLEYDGVSWRLIETSTRTTVRSLALDGDDRVYVGGVSDLGYLAPNPSGRLEFVPLLDRIPADARAFGDVWRTYVLPDGVYFQTEAAIFRWANDTMHVIRAPVRFNRAAVIDDRLYLSQPDHGLTVLEGDTFTALPGTLALANEPYGLVLPYDAGRLLIGTRTGGLYLYDGSALVPFPTDVDPLIKSGNLYRGLVLPDGTIALMTTSAGAAIVDTRGRLVRVLNRRSGLGSDIVYYAMVDREGALWLARQGGLSRVETPSPVSFYGEDEGADVGAASMLRHDGRLYAATSLGALSLRPGDADAPPRFVALQGVRNQCWWLATMVDPDGAQSPDLLLGASDGLYRIEGERATPIKLNTDGFFSVAVLRQSTADPTRLWLGLFNGLASFRRVNGQWIDEGRIDGITDQVRTLHENADGSLWAGTQATGLLRLTPAAGVTAGAGRPAMSVERFGVEHGLQPGGVFVNTVGATPYFLVGGDEPFVARFDAGAGRFTPEPTFDVVGVNLRTAGFGLIESEDGRVFVNLGRETAIMQKQADGTWAVDRQTFSRFRDQGVFFLYPEVNGVTWFTSGTQLVRFDLSRDVRQTRRLTPLIRSVSVNQGDLLYGGAGSLGDTPRLDPAVSALRFEFATPAYVGQTSIQYQSRLEGLENDWSAWTTETRRDYTNLGLGDYRFRARARDLSGEMSEEAIYAFTILPPWYRTWAAYALYVLLLGAAVFAADRVQRRRVIAKERERAQWTEAKLRAEAAEALAKSESEGKKNIELISDIGREITASLDFDIIFLKLYEHVKQLAPADVFGVGIYHPDRRQIEYRLAIEDGKRYTPYTRDTSDPDQFPVWCVEHRQPVFINDVEREASRYIAGYDNERRLLEDGTLSREPQSLIYLPLLSKDRVLGIITVQSFEKHAYSEHHLNVMQSLASYTSVALDNASAYRQLNEQEHEIRRLFEEAERARAIAEEADAAKSAFLSTVSHELRTPLTSVLGFAKIIKKRLEERVFPAITTDDKRLRQTMQQVQENLQVVVSEGERLTKLIDDVLDLAKIEAGKLEWHMDAVAIPEVIEHATAATASLFDQKGLQLVKDVEADLPVVTGDRDRLIQVVINLISNAVKFTDAGSVTCRAVRRGDEIVISIVDTGLGITPADQPKVFERFKQVGDTLTDKPKGTGLGLPISREIVEHHAGRIWVESEPGKGSTFSFSLPIVAAVKEAPVDLAAIMRQLREHVVVSTPRTTEREPRILVVDDDPNIRELLTQEFLEGGYQVTVASNGREAVAEVRRQRPDLIVLDVMMPEMNGFDVAAVIRNDPQTADIPIVILSIVQDRERGYRLGVDRYLTKPIDTDLLFKEVGELLEQRKSHKRVLIVDEDASTARTLTDVLRQRGYSVNEARSDELLEKAKALQPDIIMLNSGSPKPHVVQMLRFEKGLENVLFLVYQ